jgi:hypothetical protein
MADVAISALPAATSIAGADTIPLVQGGVTKKGTVSQVPGVLPTGGTAGQVLQKNSATNYDAGWITPTTTSESIWNYKNVVTMADPATGNVRFNNLTFGSATACAISKNDGNGTDRTPLLASLQVGDIIEVQDQTNAANWARYNINAAVVNNTTWFQIPIAFVTGSGTNPTNNDNLLLTFNTSGGGGGAGVVSSVFGRTGAVVATSGDYSFSLVSGTAAASQLPVMVASGASHAAGIAPDPGATAGTTRFLREDATWVAAGGGGSHITATVDQTAAAETVHPVYTVPANSAAVGSTYRINVFGNVDTAATVLNYTIRLRWGGVTGTQLLTLTPAFTTVLSPSSTNNAWRLSGLVTVRTTGTTGTVFANLTWADAGQEILSSTSGTTGITVDTTTAKDLVMTAATTAATQHFRTLGGGIEVVPP